MREIHPDLAPYWLGGLLQAASVDGHHPGSPEIFADALRRGASCTADFSALDHLALAEEPLETLRSELGIPPRAA
jgi:hypothetical protein